MMSDHLDCPVCGYAFSQPAEAACRSCPLRRGCPLVCCPSCGHVTADVERSRFARFISPVLHRDSGPPSESRPDRTLADVAPGQRGVVRGFGPGVQAAERQQLEAYGLSAGSRVTVLQHSPVTVVQIDHTELAFEAELAETVLIDDGA